MMKLATVPIALWNFLKRSSTLTIRRVYRNIKKGWGWLIHAAATVLAAVIVIYTFRLIENWQSPSVLRVIEAVEETMNSHRSFVVIEFILMILMACLIFWFIFVLRNLRLAKMAKGVGLFVYRPNASPGAVKKSEAFLKKESGGCREIFIRAATGWRTFGDPESPLHRAVKTSRSVRIILSYPLSEAIADRANDLERDLNEYREEIYESIEYLATVRRQSRTPEEIILKMYDTYPLWRYLIVDNCVWVQQYPRDEDVRNTPYYGFEGKPRTENIITVFDHVRSQYVVNWNSRRLGTYNFDTETVVSIKETGEVAKKIR